MNYLEVIHSNDTGAVHAIRSLTAEDLFYTKVQLQIGDVAIILEVDEMEDFLKVVHEVKEKKLCTNATVNEPLQIIKCDTLHAEVKIKAGRKVLKDLEELVLAVICDHQIDHILLDHDITK